MEIANLAVTLWAGIWVVLAAVIAYRARSGDRLTAASWMIAVAAFLAVQEDPGLVLWFASVSPSVDHDAVRGLVHAHTLGHMYGAGVMAIAGLALCVWVARTALRRGERWAWYALLAFFLLTATTDLSELLFIYPHGLPFGALPADGVHGFGWAQLVAWIGIWAAALAYARPSLRKVAVST
ncbi:MAG TPA: hypothetical protein VIO62_01715 [Candidatus Dormibacteraeota bacterium]|jgi:hypothetical protein